MAKNLKINIKNVQIAEALNLSSLKEKLKKKKEEAPAIKEPKKSAAVKPAKSSKRVKKTEELAVLPEEEAPRVRARSKSVFEEAPTKKVEEATIVEQPVANVEVPAMEAELVEETSYSTALQEEQLQPFVEEEGESVVEPPPPVEVSDEEIASAKESITVIPPQPQEKEVEIAPKTMTEPPVPAFPTRAKLGPTGRHVRDLLPPPPAKRKPVASAPAAPVVSVQPSKEPDQKIVEAEREAKKSKAKVRVVGPSELAELEEELGRSKKGAKPKFKEFRDLKPLKRKEPQKGFDVRDRHGLRNGEEENEWRKKRSHKMVEAAEDATIRPSHLKLRLPIRVKDLAAEMKLKASELIGKLFLNGLMLTLNDFLDDETTIQLLGQELGCEISIDTSEEKRIKITDKSVKEEIKATLEDQLILRPPVVAFMGHVDHGKTSLIDAIRSSNRAAGEAGAITQHIGAFRCHTSVGDITVLDTPGHEAFSAMRARGADVTDIIVLVIAGDEGMRQQTLEAIQHARAANVTIVVAINKCDKPNFNAETVYRQLADNELLPEAWGGTTVTVNCSAVTKEGINALLEMLALQAEVLELKANPAMRARGAVLESEMHKGLGAVSTILVQNGTLRHGDALVFGQTWGRVKTMQDEFGRPLKEAGPSTPVEITGLSGLPTAGEEFIAVKDEKEARLIAEARSLELRATALQKTSRSSMESLFQEASGSGKKILNIILRADVQGSLEAIRAALQKIESQKAELNIIFAGVGEVSESDVQLAAASKAMILGFHTQVEGHAETFIKQYDIRVRLHDIIYHAIDDVKNIMTGMLDKIAEEHEKGKALVKAVFKSSQAGRIAGCEVSEGTIHRSNHIRVMREGKMIWKGTISSLRRVQEDVREVAKGLECGIVLNGFTEMREGDILEAYEIIYISQEL